MGIFLASLFLARRKHVGGGNRRSVSLQQRLGRRQMVGGQLAAIGHHLVANLLSASAETDTDAGKMGSWHDKSKPGAAPSGPAGRGSRLSWTEPLRGLSVFRAMEEERRLRADIARYRRTLRIVFDPDVTRRIEEMIKLAEDRLREIERLP